jgi:chromosome segregation ATPase
LGYTNDQLTHKIEKLIQESEKLNDLSVKSKREFEELKSRISREGAKKKQEFEHLKVKAQEESDQRLTSLKRDLEKDHLTERTILDAKIKDLQRRLLAKENECNSMRVEVDRNETLLQEKEEEIDDLKSRFLELQKNSQEEIGDLTIMVETLQRSQMDTKYYESKFDAERESFTKQMALMEEDKDETLVRSQVFEREKKNLQVKVDQLFTECGDWKEKFRASVPQKE